MYRLTNVGLLYIDVIKEIDVFCIEFDTSRKSKKIVDFSFTSEYKW